MVFEGKVFSLLRRNCYHRGMDTEYDFYTIHTMDWINVVALNEEGEFIMVKQHRIGTDSITIETPGGLVNSDEAPKETALRELLEETGYTTDIIILLKKMSVNPAVQDNDIYIYYAQDCRKVAPQDLDEAEDIEVITCTPDEIKAMIDRGAIEHSIVINALNLYFMSQYHKRKGPL